MFCEFHIVRLETQSEKYMAPNITAWSIWNLQKNRFFVFFRRFEGLFRVQKSIFTENYVSMLHVSKPSKLVGNSCMYFF